MSGAVYVAVAAALGNFLQGWDIATIAGSITYIKKEFKLEHEPAIEGLIVAMSLIGAACVTTCSGGLADWLGRRPMLITSSILYFLGGLVMLWSPNVYILLLARILDGFGVGLAVTVVPIYISEIALPETRGLLTTLPQFTGSIGMFVAYCLVFGMSLTKSPNWRLMFGVLSIPSFIYFLLTIFFLPESPRWLVSKGRMVDAKKVLQRLRNKQGVSGEMALLVEGLGVGRETSIEEYVIGPDTDDTIDLDVTSDKDQIKLYGLEGGLSLVARPVTGQSAIGLLFRQRSTAHHRVPLMDPLVVLFGGVHENLAKAGSMQSMLFPHLGSMFSIAGTAQPQEWDEENAPDEREGAPSEDAADESDDSLESPLISRQATGNDKNMVPASSIVSLRSSFLMQGNAGESGTIGIGGGWQLAWKYTERDGQDGNKEGGFQRIYFKEAGVPAYRRGSAASLLASGTIAPESEFFQAAALVSQPALYSKDLWNQNPVEPAMVHPAETVTTGSYWSDLFEPGVKHALALGVGIQILQQFSGINGVLYYTPQVLEQAGVSIILSNLGLSASSTLLIISALTTLLMLPGITVAMRLTDLAGRRSLLLGTIPILFLSLLMLVITSVVHMSNVVHAAISTVSVVLYFCFFVLGFGPIPNILCAEIFPTRVRGLCMAVCALAFWICNIIVTYSIPILLSSVGLAGVFGVYGVVCIISWVYVFLKVPETKGMPLEVISEFFAVGARQQAESARII